MRRREKNKSDVNVENGTIAINETNDSKKKVKIVPTLTSTTILPKSKRCTTIEVFYVEEEIRWQSPNYIKLIFLNVSIASNYV
mmetsp:Transcript_18499/g.28108  ORF Transcript_18499/g.28108 Transcript_18499/m.28108 type:complete len:83 (+) Transcript_18499:256-504(+)